MNQALEVHQALELHQTLSVKKKSPFRIIIREQQGQSNNSTAYKDNINITWLKENYNVTIQSKDRAISF